MSKAKADELFLRWAKKEAVPIELDWTSSLTSFASDLFDSQLCGKKIVFLGEPDHFVVEKYQYQLLFIRRLRELGWNLIGREIGRSDGDRINRFVQSGDESYLNSVQLYGASDSNCAVSRMCPEGLMSPVAGSGVCDFLSVEFQFARALRDLAKLRDNESSIRFFGFDIDVFPGGAYTDIAELLAKSTDSSVSTQLLFDLVPRLGEKLSEEVIRLEQASKRAQLLTRSLEKSIGIDETNSLV
ncbi:MAG: hypothetical protein K2X81_01975, partial [Candidatus Obscuribacterales bacterium]|nr:hypothetical protein [Candidatus Obscuribacterales bacterium]